VPIRIVPPPRGVARLSDLEELAWDSWPPADEIATAMESKPADEGAVLLSKLDPDFAYAIIKSSNLSADKAQSVLYKLVDNGLYDKLIEIMTADADALIVSSDTSISGVAFYKEIRIDSGVVLEINGGPGVLVTRALRNSGTIRSAWVKGSGASSTSCGGGSGGDGAGAVIVFAVDADLGTIEANGGDGGNGAPSSGHSAGGAGGDGEMWIVSGDAPGAGGSGGRGGGAGNPNGGGGGGVYSYAGGAGGSVTTTSFASLADLIAELAKAIVDYWLVNVVGKTPSTTKSIPNLGGAGGGSGACNPDGGEGAGGGGGGGGGQVIVFAVNLNGGTINAKGGNGGNGQGGASQTAGGGGGGGGGIVYVAYKNLINSPTIDVSGGSGGQDGAGETTYAGESGSAGVYRVEQI